MKRLEAQKKARKERDEWEQERSLRQHAEQRADRLERALREREEDQRESPVPGQEGLSEDSQGVRESLWKRLFPRWEEQEEVDEWTPRLTSPPESPTPETTAWEPPEGQPESEKPKRGIWLPHPDDERDRRNLGKGEGG